MYPVSAIILTIFVFIVGLWIRWRKQKFDIFKRNNIPGPDPNFFYGNLPEFNKKRKDIIEEWIQKYGKIFGFFLGAKPFLICADVEFLKLCQIKDVKNFINKDWILPDAGISHKSSDYVLGIQKGEKWKDLRSILSSCFSSGKIKMMSTLMSHPINTFLKNVKNKNETPFNIAELTDALIFDIICTSAFGVTTNVQNKESNLFIKSTHEVFGINSADPLGLLSVLFPEIEPLLTFFRRFKDTINYLIKKPAVGVVYDTCKNIINARKSSKYRPPDLLQTIIDAEDETATERKKLSVDFVIANAMLFMAAGYDSSSTIIVWGIHHLAQNPEIQKKLRQEINNNIEKDVEIQYSDLNDFQYLDQVTSEILRFWPFSCLSINRLCAEDVRYKDMIIPKGSIVTAPIPFLHNDPSYWHEPHKFDPERFSLDKRGKIDSIMYQPFGVGPRMCIGMRLAKTVIKLVIANLIRSFQIEPYGEKEVEVNYSLFINHPKNGIFVKAIPISA